MPQIFHDKYVNCEPIVFMSFCFDPGCFAWQIPPRVNYVVACAFLSWVHLKIFIHQQVYAPIIPGNNSKFI